MGRVTRRLPALRVDVSDPASPAVVRRPDTVTVEEPLEIRVGGVPLSVTMRTPGDDFDLTIGHLVTEGLLHGAAEVKQLMHCLDADESGSPTYNVVDVTLAEGARLHARPASREGYTTSACGVCGKSSIEAITTQSRYAVAQDPVEVSPAMVAALPQALKGEQRVFARTGGLHAAAVFSPDGEVLAAREDVGRHNAVDKVVGWAAREDRLPLSGHVLAISARASFELVQKALMAGIPMVVAVSAPSSLAVDLAEAAGLTLVGFARPPHLTVYAGAHRLGLRPDGHRSGPVSGPAAEPASGPVSEPVSGSVPAS
jgi:FdhD protein